MTVVVAFAAAAVWAKTTTWQGPSGGNWNAEDNWNGGLPAAGDTVILNASSVNDIEGLSLASITFAGSGAYTVSGNAVTVTDGAGLTVEAGATATNELALTFSANQTWLVKGGGTIVMNESFDAGSHTLTINAESNSKMGVVWLMKPNVISGQVTVNQGEVYVCDDKAFGTAAVKNEQVERTELYARFIFVNVTMANAFTVMDSNKDGSYAYGNFKAYANTTNVFTGKITFAKNSYYPIVPPTSQIVFAGGLSVKQYWRGNYYDSLGGEAVITNTPVTLNWLGYASNYNKSGNGRPNVRFSCTGNKITGQIRLTQNAKMSFGVDDAIDVTSEGSYLNNLYGTVDLSGYSQHLRGFRNCWANNGVITSATDATLYMNQCDDYTLQSGCYASFGGQITGKASLSKYGAKKLTLGSNTSDTRTFTTAGYLEVTEGDLELNEKAVWSSGDVRVSGSGNLILNDIANLPNTSVITVTTNETSTAKITLNGTVQVAKLIINGEQLDEDTYTREKLGELIAGDGAVVVSDPSRQPKTTTWTGAAGGNWSDKANWDKGKPLAGDTVVLTASSVNDIPNLLLGGLTYGGKGGYATTGQGVMLNGPLSTITEPDGDVGLVRVFTNDLSIAISGTQTWTIESTNTTLVCTQPITSQTLLTCAGYGTLELRADNALTGGFYTKQTCVHAYRDASFSASGDGSVGIERISKSTRGRLWLHGVTIKNDISENEVNDYRHGLVSAAGTTNVLKGLFKTNASVYPGVQKDSTLIFEGGVHSENKNLFRPCGGFQGGQKESGSNDPTSWVIIRNKPITNCQGLSYDESCSIRFEVAGNDFTKNPQDAKQKYSGVTIFGSRTRVETAVPYAFDFADGNGPIRRLEGTLDLCGNDQRVGGFTYLDCNNGQITSDEPATLYLVQKLLQSNGSSTPSAKALQQNIAGQVSISKAGTNTMYLAKAKTSTGRLEVTEGDLNLAADFSWAGTNIVVSGTNTVASMGDVVKPGNLVINGKGNLNRDSVLKVYGDGTVTFGSSVLVTVAELWKTDEDGVPVRMEPGNYTKANCSFVKGDGILHVRGGGLVIFMR